MPELVHRSTLSGRAQCGASGAANFPPGVGVKISTSGVNVTCPACLALNKPATR